MTPSSFLFYTGTLNCTRHKEHTDILHVEGLAWHLIIQSGALIAVDFVPRILGAITNKVAAAAKQLHKEQVCGLLLRKTFKYDKCFYTTRSICKTLQASVNSALEKWTTQCIDYVRAGIVAVRTNSTPPDPTNGICEDFNIQYDPLTESQHLLAHLETDGNLAGTGPIRGKRVSRNPYLSVTM